MTYKRLENVKRLLSYNLYVWNFKNFLVMACLHPVFILSPETRWLKKCRKENRPYEYYIHQANQRRNLQFDPAPLVDNPFDYYSPHLPQRRMCVPCGKCELCQKDKVTDLFIRNYFEWLYTRSLGGSSFFITLTYADNVLPHLDDGTPCFDVKHLQNWLKRIRRYYDYDFKYCLVSEYGGEFGRPHYHGLLYFPKPINQIDLLDAIAKTWTKIDDRRPYYAMDDRLDLFDVQRVHCVELNDPKLIRYCSKYCAKQIGAEQFDALDIDCRYKRHTLKSIGLGEHIYDFCNRDIWQCGYIEVDGFKYHIPQYYKLKKMREYYCQMEDGSIIYRPTDFKLQYSSEMCRKQLVEHKDLCALNIDYPKVPDCFYDPVNLNKLWKYMDDYIVFREHDTDLETQILVDDWCDYLLEVQKYNKSQFIARAKKWQQQQRDHYLKKTHRK